MSEYIIEAAGGNATAIVVIDCDGDREWYEAQGRELMARTEHLGVEQAGFLNLNRRHFEMSGGEFCGNAARAAAMLIAHLTSENSFTFTMSGYDGPVSASVTLGNQKDADVTCSFPNMRPEARNVILSDGKNVKVVDLGGIVHVFVEGEFFNDPNFYEPLHREITNDLGLNERSAVGVCWLGESNGRVLLHPVVWVRGIDSFFYETACGSGSIAAGVATGQSEIVQPSGQVIHVDIASDGVHLTSQMEIVNHGE